MERGFTLLELLATVAIASIVLGVGAPAAGRALDSYRTSATLAALTSSLATGRMAAVSRNQPVVLCPSIDGERCTGEPDWSPGWIVFTDIDRDRTRSSDEPLIAHEAAAPGQLRISSTGGRRHIRFQPTGMAEGTNLTLSICRGPTRLARVIVNNGGRARVERTTGACAGP